jgi:hypothetical protein
VGVVGEGGQGAKAERTVGETRPLRGMHCRRRRRRLRHRRGGWSGGCDARAGEGGPSGGGRWGRGEGRNGGEGKEVEDVAARRV